MQSKQSCKGVCKGFQAIGLDACLGCAGMSNLEKMSLQIVKLQGIKLDKNGRCKHNMLPGQCSYCAGIKMPAYGASVGLAFIK